MTRYGSFLTFPMAAKKKKTAARKAPPPPGTIGARLFAARVAAGEHNRALLARRLGIGELALYRLEDNITARLRDVNQSRILCKTLGITEAWLYHGEGEGPKAPSPEDVLRSEWAEVVERYLTAEDQGVHPATAQRLRALDWVSGGFLLPRVKAVRRMRSLIDDDRVLAEHERDDDSE